MTEIVTWKCDGCDDTLVYRPSMSTDWNVYGVLLEGAKGYPICHTEDEERGTYHLCPSCARHLFEVANPKQWPRMARPKLVADDAA